MKKIIVILILINFISCTKKEDNSFRLSNKYVISTNAPTTGSVNQPIEIEVHFAFESGCGTFNRFIETTHGEIINIEVEAKYENNNNNCTDQYREITKIYTFTPTYPEVYTFQFQTGEHTFITDTITINP